MAALQIPNGQVIPSWGNMDDPVQFQQYLQEVLDPEVSSFVVDFGRAEAKAVFNVPAQDWPALLQLKRSETCNTRWIHIWAPDKQKETVREIASHYEVSTRLLAIMTSDQPDVIPKPQIQSPHRHNFSNFMNRTSFDFRRHRSGDVEGGSSIALQSPISIQQQIPRHDYLNHYKLVRDVWHYSSVDWGAKYLCLGYNCLQTVSIDTERPSDYKAEDTMDFKDKPQGKRTWMWLLLCSDGTVISMQEDTFPGHTYSKDSNSQKAELEATRRNLLHIFQQLSTAGDPAIARNALMILPFRDRQDGRGIHPKESALDVASELFYYLFDDWHFGYDLISRKYPYAADLENLRKHMLEKAHVNNIERLHHLGRQLGTLKRIYRSYISIIDRVIAGQHDAESLHHYHQENSGSETPRSEGNDVRLGAPLSKAAKVRFERLRDRIELYAMSEVQECLDEKDALVFMNFNLITIKESQNVERLTRITIFLAKATIVFLPISLMTAYFSTQLDDIQGLYTVKTYWGCFGVLAALSIIALFAFDIISERFQGRVIDEPLRVILANFSKQVLRKDD